MLDSNIIECKKLNKSYSGVHALKNFSLNIKKNSVVGLIGDNGAGKSTLIKILSGAHQQDTGDLFFENNILLIFAVEVQVFTVAQIPLQFHCISYRQTMQILNVKTAKKYLQWIFCKKCSFCSENISSVVYQRCSITNSCLAVHTTPGPEAI